MSDVTVERLSDLAHPHHPRRRLGTGPRALSGTVYGKWPGVSAKAWAREGSLADRPEIDFADARRLVVVSPHDDDDILGVGATIMRASAAELPVRVCTVTGRLPDDSASPARRSRIQAVTELGVPWSKLQYFGLDEGRVPEQERALVDTLRRVLRPGDVVITTWWHDGNPDHEATGRAVRVVAEEIDVPVLGAFVWTWHWARPTNPIIPWSRCRVLWPSDQERATKEAAWRSQRAGRVEQSAARETSTTRDPDARITEPVRFKRILGLPELFIVAEPGSS